ncbi:MAG TPA: hypothetical protein VF085_03310 [Solirubrobacterales bacterium]
MAGKGFPGPAIFAPIVLLVALGIAVLVGSRLLASTTVTPHLSVAPGLGVALGDAVEVAPGPEPARAPGLESAVAPARQAVGGGSTLTVNRAGVDDRGGSGAQPRIAAARVVAMPASSGPREGSPASPRSEPSPVPQPALAPTVVPVAALALPPAPVVAPTDAPSGPGGGPSGPIAAGAGPVGAAIAEGVEIQPGQEYAFSFSFYIQPAVYRPQGEENLILRLGGEAGESPSFGLQLWDDGSGSRGLWAGGDAMGGERFLAPVAEGVWHEALLCFKASNEDGGFYLLLLDGWPIDARPWVGPIDSGSRPTRLTAGLFRAGKRVSGSPGILFGPAELSETMESVIP